MFIDIHGHVLREQTFPAHGRQTLATPDQLMALHDRLGIERGVILPLGNVENSVCCQSNEEALWIAANFPGRFIPFCNVDPRNYGNSWLAPLGDILKYYRDKGCKGVGEVCANLPFLDPRVQNLFKGAEEAGLPLTFHISPFQGYAYGLVDDAGLPQLEVSLQRFPNLKFFGHSQAFWCEIGALRSTEERFGYPSGKIEEEGRVPQLMRKYPNLYGDLSACSGYTALSRDPDYAARFLTEFQDRLFFGTDICCPQMTNFGRLYEFLPQLRDEGKITNEVFEKVAFRNAKRVLGLD